MTDTTTAVTPATDEEIKAWVHTWETTMPEPDWSIEASLIARIEALKAAVQEAVDEQPEIVRASAAKDATIARLREELERVSEAKDRRIATQNDQLEGCLEYETVQKFALAERDATIARLREVLEECANLGCDGSTGVGCIVQEAVAAALEDSRE